jgi:hypothetical protein
VLLAHDDILPFSSVAGDRICRSGCNSNRHDGVGGIPPRAVEREVALAGELFAKLPEIGPGALGELSLESGRRLMWDTSRIQPATRAASEIIASAKPNAPSCASDASCSILPEAATYMQRHREES